MLKPKSNYRDKVFSRIREEIEGSVYKPKEASLRYEYPVTIDTLSPGAISQEHYNVSAIIENAEWHYSTANVEFLIAETIYEEALALAVLRSGESSDKKREYEAKIVTSSEREDYLVKKSILKLTYGRLKGFLSMKEALSRELSRRLDKRNSGKEIT